MPKKNQDLPGIEGKGVEKPSIKEIDEAADTYIGARDKRILCSAREVETKTRLMELMKRNKLKTYEYDDHIVELVMTEETVKVKNKPKEEDE